MTRDKFYAAASKLGKKVHADESVCYKDGELQYRFISIRADGLAVTCESSYEKALEAFAALDPGTHKAHKIAALKKEIEDLES